MRTRIDRLHVLASRALLPDDRETVELSTGCPKRPQVTLPAFTQDPRQADGVPARLGRRVDRFAALAYRSVRELVGPLDMPVPDRIGVFFANTRAGWAYAEPQFDLLFSKGPTWVHPYFVTAWFPAAGIGEVTIGLGYQGCAKVTTGRLSGFAEALWLARDALERQAIDLAIIGAVESVVSPYAMLHWPVERALPTTGAAEGAVVLAVRPWPAADGAGGAVLHGLRYEGTDRSTAADDDWIPTLSIAAELARRASDTAGAADVALGGGYHVTVGDGPGTTTRRTR